MVKPHNRAYLVQKNLAKARGIPFLLSYEEWIAWWGDDIIRRGKGRDCLQMQRYGDSGAYELGNIKKGFPVDNARTAAKCRANRAAEKRRIEHQKHLDSLMFAESKLGIEKESGEEYTDLEKAMFYRQEFAIDR